MSAIRKISVIITNEIAAQGNVQKSRWLENYVKHGIQSKGVSIPQIRDIVKRTHDTYQLSDIPVAEQAEFLSNLMEQPFTEDKLAAILYIQLYWKKTDESITLNLIREWFDNHWITDWNVCDWLCVRILTPLIETSAIATINELANWNLSANLWKARASLVPFAPVKAIENHRDVILQFSGVLIKRKERFSKTAVGWVLREYSKKDPELVQNFLSAHEQWTTSEVVKNALKYR